MKTNLTLELDLTIEYEIHPGEPATLHYPGCPAEIEILNIEIMDRPVSEGLFNEIMVEFENEIREWCVDDAADHQRAAAEAHYDSLEDR